MSVRAAIVDGEVTPERERAVAGDARAGGGAGVGAVVRFEGIVRRMEGGRALSALDYQAYEPMAQREMERLGREVAARFGLEELLAVHSRGRVRVGGCSLVLVARAAHRKEALAAAGEYIDALKRDVPIWKQPVWET